MQFDFENNTRLTHDTTQRNVRGGWSTSAAGSFTTNGGSGALMSGGEACAWRGLVSGDAFGVEGGEAKRREGRGGTFGLLMLLAVDRLLAVGLPLALKLTRILLFLATSRLSLECEVSLFKPPSSSMTSTVSANDTAGGAASPALWLGTFEGGRCNGVAGDLATADFECGEFFCCR